LIAIVGVELMPSEVAFAVVSATAWVAGCVSRQASNAARSRPAASAIARIRSRLKPPWFSPCWLL
jgi:outer membrane murein-binding lipoprotein Lpp